jgi:hypothetical protein
VTLCIAIVFLWIPGTQAAVIQAGPADNVEAMIGGLVPGDELVLADGVYDINERFSFAIAGSADAPILIRAAAGAHPHFRQQSGQNIWDINASHTVIRGLEFSGGSAGLRVEAASFLTIEDCHIHHTGDVAVRMNDVGQTYESVQILHNEIHDTSGTGEGMYLGCNSNGCRLARALIAGNHVHHTDGAGVSQGDGIELKEGSHACVIRDNVIHNTNYPCILTYSTVGNGAANLIEGNVLWACGDHGIQTSADAILRNNILLGAAGEGIAIQPHQAGNPANIQVVHNTVLQAVNNAIALRGVVGDVLVANNALYAQSASAINPVNGDFSQVTVTGNVGQGGVAGGAFSIGAGDLNADFIAAHYDGTLPIDLFPKAGGALVDAGDPAYVTEIDFNHTPRLGQAHVGAYHYRSAGNPGWAIAEEFKEFGGTQPDPDGSDGADGDGGLDAGSDTDAGRDADAGSNADAGGDAQAPADAHDGGGPDEDEVDGAGSGDPAASIRGGCHCATDGAAGGWSWLPLLLVGWALFRAAKSRHRNKPPSRRVPGDR